jgi:hypothetical protein
VESIDFIVVVDVLSYGDRRLHRFMSELLGNLGYAGPLRRRRQDKLQSHLPYWGR